MTGQEVQFMRLPISLPCPVPIRPGDPTTLDADGEPIDLAKRTEVCAVDAFWMIGHQVCCDVHARDFCRIADIDYEQLVAESGGEFSTESKPWSERHRYDQDFARAGQS